MQPQQQHAGRAAVSQQLHHCYDVYNCWCAWIRKRHMDASKVVYGYLNIICICCWPPAASKTLSCLSRRQLRWDRRGTCKRGSPCSVSMAADVITQNHSV